MTTRPYTKRRRAELEEETRRRITAATVELHREVGPARTTISAIAERAGVERLTVYRHFPDDRSMFEACTSHYARWCRSRMQPDGKKSKSRLSAFAPPYSPSMSITARRS